MKKDQDTPTDKPAAKSPVVSRRYQFSGPMPHPKILNEYDPKTREIIVRMADRQSQHRQLLESSVVHSNIQNEKAGMFIATIITLTMIFGGIYLLMNDKSVIGFLMIFGTSIFQAGNYVYNKNREESDMDDGEEGKK